VEQELVTLLEAPEFIPLFNGVHITKSMVFCVVFCRSLCVLLSFAHCILVVFRLTASNYPFGTSPISASTSLISATTSDQKKLSVVDVDETQ
jgi:hypothetical protein